MLAGAVQLWSLWFGCWQTLSLLSLCSCSSKKYSELETWPQGGGGNTKNLLEHECVLGGWGAGVVSGRVRQEAHGKLEVFTKLYISLSRGDVVGGNPSK